MLSINSISYSIGGRTLLKDASCFIAAGKKIGFVGPNGSGKTTLLRLILQKVQLEKGSIDLQKRCSIQTVSQDAPGGDSSPLETVIGSDEERDQLLKEAETATDPKRIAYIHERLCDIDAYTATARASLILAGLGFDQEAAKRPLKEFSGGWRMRVALAQALFSSPDLLLLDEPTNHLDLESIMWLESYLKSYPGTLIVVSHDRDLLNRVSDDTLVLENHALSMYTGNFDAYLKVKSQKEMQRDALAAKQEARRNHLQSFVDRFKAKATKAKQAQSRIKALEKMIPVSEVENEKEIIFKFPQPLNKQSPLLKLENICAGYEVNNPILKDLFLSIYSDDKIALLGANGNGKSTFVKLVAGVLEPFSGELVKASKLNIGYFAQDHLEQLSPGINAIEQVAQAMPDSPVSVVRNWLGRFGFPNQRQETIVGNLSGGEKTRLALSLTALKKPNLMLLDEPTNHLDMASREALVRAINEFEGAVVLISHDSQLIESTCDQLWLVEEGTCKQFFGDMDDYRQLLISKRQEKNKNSQNNLEKQTRKDNRREAAKKRELLSTYKKASKEAEKKLEELLEQKNKLDIQLADPLFYTQSSEKYQK
jgi:ATP-binding cassette, subfamily F, member 3